MRGRRALLCQQRNRELEEQCAINKLKHGGSYLPFGPTRGPVLPRDHNPANAKNNRDAIEALRVVAERCTDGGKKWKFLLRYQRGLEAWGAWIYPEDVDPSTLQWEDQYWSGFFSSRS